MGRALVAILMTLSLGGCAEETPDPSQQYSSRQLGDTTFVFSSSPLRGTASLREVSRIGMIEGPPEYLLSRLPVFTVGPDGSLCRRSPRRPAPLRCGRHLRKDDCPARPGPRRGDVRGQHGRLHRRGVGRAGLQQSTRQCLFARRHPGPGDQTTSVGGTTGIRAGCPPMGRTGSALDLAQPAPEGPGHAPRGAAETVVRTPDRPRGSDGHGVPPNSSLGGL